MINSQSSLVISCVGVLVGRRTALMSSLVISCVGVLVGRFGDCSHVIPCHQLCWLDGGGLLSCHPLSSAVLVGRWGTALMSSLVISCVGWTVGDCSHVITCHLLCWLDGGGLLSCHPLSPAVLVCWLDGGGLLM